MKTKLVIGSAVLALLLVLAGPVPAGEERRELTKEQAHEILKGLEQGMAALMKLGRHDQAQGLQKVADGLRERLKQSQEGPQRERKELAHHVEIMIWGVKALIEAERHDAADLLERAVHARKMDLAGRKDDEAHMIREKSPGPGDIAELLLHAGGIWQEFGNHERAEAVFKLGRHYQEIHHRAQKEREQRANRERPREERRDRPRQEKPDRPRPDRPEGGDAHERLGRLERQLQEMMHAMKKLTGEMERLRNQLNR